MKQFVSEVVLVLSLAVAALILAGCSSPVAPTPQPVSSFPSQLRAEVSCEQPTNVWVGQTQGRTDITWDGAGDKFLVWLEVEDHNVYVSVPGSPATADNNRYETRSLDIARTHAVQVQSVCGDSYSPRSASVVFGGSSGPVVPAPQPPVNPCVTLKTTGQRCTGGGCGNECP